MGFLLMSGWHAEGGIYSKTNYAFAPRLLVFRLRVRHFPATFTDGAGQTAGTFAIWAGMVILVCIKNISFSLARPAFNTACTPTGWALHILLPSDRTVF